jgi:hypothetical protein
VQEVWRQLEGEVLAGFAPEELALLHGYLTRICDNLDRTETRSER